MSSSFARAGQRIAGRFDLVFPYAYQPPFAHIASWVARDAVLSRQVRAIVIDPQSPLARPITDAARRAALISDPHLVSIIHVVDHDAFAVITEIPPGSPLSARLDGTALPPQQVHAIVGEVSNAIATGARRGVRHLQCTPENIYLTREGDVVLDGLGIAAAMAQADTDKSSHDLDRDEARGLTVLTACLLCGTTFPPPAEHDDIIQRAAHKDLPEELADVLNSEISADGPISPVDFTRRIVPWAAIDVAQLPPLHEPVLDALNTPSDHASFDAVSHPPLPGVEHPSANDEFAENAGAEVTATAETDGGALNASALENKEIEAVAGSNEASLVPPPPPSGESDSAWEDGDAEENTEFSAEGAADGALPQAAQISTSEEDSLETGDFFEQDTLDEPLAAYSDTDAEPLASSREEATELIDEVLNISHDADLSEAPQWPALHDSAAAAVSSDDASASGMADPEYSTSSAPDNAVDESSFNSDLPAESLAEDTALSDQEATENLPEYEPAAVAPSEESYDSEVPAAAAEENLPYERHDAGEPHTAEIPVSDSPDENNDDEQRAADSESTAEGGLVDDFADEEQPADPDDVVSATDAEVTTRIPQAPHRVSVFGAGNSPTAADQHGVPVTASDSSGSSASSPAKNRPFPGPHATAGYHQEAQPARGYPDFPAAASASRQADPATAGASRTHTTKAKTSSRTPTQDRKFRAELIVLPLFLIIVLILGVLALQHLFAPFHSVDVSEPEVTSAHSEPAPAQNPPPAPSAPPQIAKATLVNPDAQKITSADPAIQDNPQTVGQAIDGNPQTAWKTWTYQVASMAPSTGLGLYIELAQPATITEVTLNVSGQGGHIQLRDTVPSAPTSGKLLGESTISPTTTFKLAEPFTGSAFLLWITEMPVSSEGTFQFVLNEVSVK
ncbi:hypothetical protein [Trueperella sp. LYQ141]|uniref:hypothetical protein n=1 Tax=Trueperella sp. LYQ141 TaxID=3391058 RepID=UPI0039836473